MRNRPLGERLLSGFINICESKSNKAGNHTARLSFLHPAPFFFHRRAFEMRGVIVTATKGKDSLGGGGLIMRGGGGHGAGSRRKKLEESPWAFPLLRSFPFYCEWGRHLHSFADNRCVLLLYCVCFAIAECGCGICMFCTKHKSEESASPLMFGNSTEGPRPPGPDGGVSLASMQSAF